MSESHNQLITRWAQAQNRGLISGGDVPSLDRLAITIDKVRVHLLEISAGRVLVEARVTDLVSAEREKSELLDRMLKTSTARMRAHGMTLAVDSEGSAFWLQATVQADAEIKKLTEVIEKLTTEVELWRAIL